MGCFLACFGSSKDAKHRKNLPDVSAQNPNLGHRYQPIIHPNPTVVAKQEDLEKHLTVVPQARVKPEERQLSSIKQSNPEEQLSLGSHKKVTFDSNVKEYDHISGYETPAITQERDKEVEKVIFDLNVKEYDHVSGNEAPGIIQEREKDVEKVTNDNSEKKTGKSSSVSDGGSTVSSLGSYPPNHRYQNWRESDDEDEPLDCELGDLDEDEDVLDDEDEEEVYGDEYCDDDDHHSRDVQEFSPVSCSSMESRTTSSRETNTLGLNLVARDRAGYVHSVLNPVENTTQWKAVKAKTTPPLKLQKENFPIDSRSRHEPKSNNIEVAVDASLSTWLGSSEKTPPKRAAPVGLDPIASGSSASSYGSNSVKSHKERRHFASSTSPRRSPADEKPLIGSVGIHWNDKTPIEDSGSASSFKGIPNTTSKYREDKRVSWHSTPFETRLQRALNKDCKGCKRTESSPHLPGSSSAQSLSSLDVEGLCSGSIAK